MAAKGRVGRASSSTAFTGLYKIPDFALAPIALTRPARRAPADCAARATARLASKSTARKAAWLPATLIVVASARYTSSTRGSDGRARKSTTCEVTFGIAPTARRPRTWIAATDGSATRPRRISLPTRPVAPASATVLAKLPLAFLRRPAVRFGAGAAHQHGALAFAQARGLEERLDRLLVIHHCEGARPVGRAVTHNRKSTRLNSSHTI